MGSGQRKSRTLAIIAVGPLAEGRSQVKRIAQKVDKHGLKSFIAIVNEDDVGLFVSMVGFTRDAEEFARSQENLVA